MNFRPVTSRRDVFKTGAALAATLVLPARAFAGPAAFAPTVGMKNFAVRRTICEVARTYLHGGEMFAVAAISRSQEKSRRSDSWRHWPPPA